MISTIGSREDALDLAELLAAYAKALRKRKEPLDHDASILDEVGVELAMAATAPGDWPAGILTRGKVLGWAHRTLAVVAHIEEQTGHELEATLGRLRRIAAELQGHASGLRATGTWAVSGIMEAPDEPSDPERAADPDDEFEAAETQRIKPIPERKKP